MNKIEEIKKLSKQELDTEIAESTKKMFKLKFEVNTGASKANSDIGKLKRYIARMNTVKAAIKIEEEKKFKSQKTV
jgi:ribosomal protein L29